MTRHHRLATILSLLFAVLILAGDLSPAFAGDEAEAAYREARRELNRSAYERAAREFARVHEQFGETKWAADAMYWDAFARYRVGRTQELQQAMELLEQQKLRFPHAETIVEAEELAMRIQAALAERGDGAAAVNIAREASKLAERVVRVTPPRPPRALSAGRSSNFAQIRVEARSEEQAELEMRLTALNALMNMDEERAIPILKKVLGNHDNDPELRSRALFILSQSDDEAMEDVLLDVVREDPEIEVRKMAVFWMGQNPGERTFVVLKDLLRDEQDEEVREQALFAIAQNESDEALVILKDLARDEGASAEDRDQAIFWIGQRGDEEGVKILKQLYRDLDSDEAKERVLFSVAQADDDGLDWLLGVARDRKEPAELRCRALFWAGQMGDVPVKDISALYRDAEDPELREQVIFTLSQQDSKAATDELIKIVREEKDPELRTQAVFWIGQSGDPRAAEFLEELINQ